MSSILSAKSGKHKVGGKSKPQKSSASKSLTVRLKLGKYKPRNFNADQLNADALRDVVEQLADGKFQGTAVNFDVSGLNGGSPEHRKAVWGLWKVVADDGRKVSLRIDNQPFARPLDLPITLLCNTNISVEEECRLVDLATEIIAHTCRPEDRPAYIDDVIGQVRKQGSSAERCKRLKSDLKSRLQNGDDEHSKRHNKAGGDSAVDPAMLARLFLTKHYQVAVSTTADADEDSESCTEQEQPSTCNLRFYDLNFYRRRAGSWVKASGDDVKLELTRFLQNLSSTQTSARQVGDVFLNVKALVALSVDGTPPLPFYIGDLSRHLLAFRNGLLDLDALASTGEPKLLPHDPNWFSESILPYEFDPNAKCRQFKKFLGQILNGDPKTLKPKTKGDNRIKVIQEAAGYVLLPDNRFQKFAIFLGSGQNGKGTFLHLLQHMIGPENCSSVRLDAMGKEFGTWSMVGKMANLCGDLNEIDKVEEGILKTWTGEDLVTVPRKHLTDLQVQPIIKFIYSCNMLPWFKDRTDGTWRRMMVVPFTHTVENPDSHLRKRLLKELPGILNWALRGLKRLLGQEGFTHCDVCAVAAAKHRTECNHVKQFLLDHFTFSELYAGSETGVQWETTTMEVNRTLKRCNEENGDKGLALHIVCRELAQMPGVTTSRPTTCKDRDEVGSLYYHGVCLGDPKSAVPVRNDEDEDGDDDTPIVKKSKKPVKAKKKASA